MLAPMENRSAERPRSQSWRTPIADVPTDGPVEVIFEALLPIPGQAVYWLLMRRRIAGFLMTICERQELNRPAADPRRVRVDAVVQRDKRRCVNH